MSAAEAPSNRRSRVAAAVAVLIVVAAALLIVGLLLERRAESGAHAPTATTAEEREGHQDESAEPAHAVPSEGAGESVERATGINLEAPWLVAVGTVVSVACAIAVWRRPTRPVIVVVVAFTAAAMMLDALEVSHKISEERIGLALLAAGIATTRAAAIAGSGYLYTTAKG